MAAPTSANVESEREGVVERQSQLQPQLLASSKADNAGLISEGDHIIVRKGKCMKVLQARKQRMVYVDKAKFKIDDIFGHPYGTQFEVRDGKLSAKRADDKRDVNVPLPPPSFPSTCGEGAADVSSGQCALDNRDLRASDDNQRLRREDVINLRKSGVHGEELVGQLIENSSTFARKTEFSQEKWIKKKQAKHDVTITVLRMSTRLLAQLYYEKDPMRICFMRPDSLAQLLTYSGVRAGSRPLVVETCQGLIVGAVLERLAGHGYAVQFFISDNPLKQRCALDDFAFTKEQLKQSLKLYPLCEVAKLGSSSTATKSSLSSTSGPTANLADPGSNPAAAAAAAVADPCVGTNGAASCAAATAEMAEGDLPAAAKRPRTDINPEETASVQAEVEQSDAGGRGDGSDGDAERKPQLQPSMLPAWQAERAAVRQVLQLGNFDTLIVATRFHPTPIVLALLDLVAPSRPFVVYHQYLEPLSDCYQALRDRGGAVNLRLTETWLREQQVLPQRTHPTVIMNSSSGYLLTGITVIRGSEGEKASSRA